MERRSIKLRYQQASEEEKARIWNNTYHTLLISGFSEAESEWAANKGFTLKEEIMKRIIARRKADIKLYRQEWGYTREQAIAELGREVNVRNQVRGMADEDLFDLMRIIYP